MIFRASPRWGDLRRPGQIPARSCRAHDPLHLVGGLTLTVPVSNPVASTPVGSAVLWDEQKAEAMFADLARGDTSNLAKYAG